MSKLASYNRKHVLLFGLTLVLLAIAFEPGVAKAATEISDLLNGDTAITRGWKFFNSLTNYAIVGGLLLIAFANVLRISIDTYAVKKVLPTLLVAFVLSNFSLLASQILLDASSSLSLTSLGLANGFGTGTGQVEALGALGALGARFVTWLDFKTIASGFGASAAGAGGLLAIFGNLGFASAGWPFVIFLAIVVLGVPLLLILGLVLLFSVRYYVLQLAIILAPVFIIGMAFPFTRTYFQKWLSVLMVWIFMRPISNLILGVGAAALTFGSLNGLFGGLVVFAVVVGALVGALLIPFQLASAASGILKGLTSLATGTLRSGAADRLIGFSKKHEGTLKGRIAEGALGALYTPEIIKMAHERRTSRIVTEAQFSAAHLTGQEQIRDQIKEKLISERAGEVKGKAAPEKTDFFLQSHRAKDNDGKIATFDAMNSEGDRSNFFYEINSRFKAIDKILKSATADAKAKEKAIKDRDELMEALGGSQVEELKKAGALSEQHGVTDTAQARSLITLAALGGKFKHRDGSNNIVDGIKMIKGKNIYTGEDNVDIVQEALVDGKGRDSSFALSRRQRYDKMNKDHQYTDEAQTVFRDDASGMGRVGTAEEITDAGANAYSDIDPQKLQTGLQKGATIRILRDSTGKLIKRIDPSLLKGHAYGHIGEEAYSQAERMRPESKLVMSDNWAETRAYNEEIVEKAIRKEIAQDGLVGPEADIRYRDRMKNYYYLAATVGPAGSAANVKEMVRHMPKATQNATAFEGVFDTYVKSVADPLTTFKSK